MCVWVSEDLTGEPRALEIPRQPGRATTRNVALAYLDPTVRVDQHDRRAPPSPTAEESVAGGRALLHLALLAHPTDE